MIDSCKDCYNRLKTGCSLEKPDIRASEPFLGKAQPDVCLSWKADKETAERVERVRQAFC